MNYSRQQQWRSESLASSSSSSCSSSSSPSPRLPYDYPNHSNRPIESVDDTSVEEVFKSVVNGRKSWKTLKGGKMVWPPELEAALLEGLARYQPDDSRETRLLGRFPMRNRFISEYILQKTGEYRSAKQVGSRLQQLRDTCGGGKKLQNLLSPCRRPGAPISNRSQYSSLLRYGFSLPPMCDSSSDTSLPGSPIPRSASLQEKPSHVTYIINIVPERTGGTTASCLSTSISNEYHHHHHQPSSTTASNSESIIGASQEPRPIRSIDPTLAFGPTADPYLTAYSEFAVFEGDSFIHKEQTPLKLADSSPTATSQGGEAFVYTTSFVPRYWHKIRECADPTKYTIHQEIHRDASQCLGSGSTSSKIFSATYKFRYPTTASPSLQSSPATSTITPGIETSQQSTTAGVSQDFPFDLAGYNTEDDALSAAMLSFDDKTETSYCYNISSHEGWTSYPATSPRSDRYGTTTTYCDDSGSSDTLSPVSTHFTPHSTNYPYQ